LTGVGYLLAKTRRQIRTNHFFVVLKTHKIIPSYYSNTLYVVLIADAVYFWTLFVAGRTTLAAAAGTCKTFDYLFQFLPFLHDRISQNAYNQSE